MLLVALVSGGVLGLSKLRGDVVSPLNTMVAPLNTPKIYGYLDTIGMRAKEAKEYIVGKYEAYFHKSEEEHKEEPRKVVVTSPKAKDVVITQQYV